MSSKLYQSPAIREAATATQARDGHLLNKGIMRAVKERKRIEAAERQNYFNERPAESRLGMLRAIVERQPDRYTLVGTGKSATMIRVDLDATKFRYAN